MRANSNPMTKLMPCVENRPTAFHLTPDIVFSFNSINDLISACHLINLSKINIKSTAWTDERHIYYLFLIPDGSIDMSIVYGILSEFGNNLKNDNILSYIKEHGKILCQSCAIEKLSVL